jgi:hypothetical protein
MANRQSAMIDAQHWLYGGPADGLKIVASSTDPIKLMAAMAFAAWRGQHQDWRRCLAGL